VAKGTEWDDVDSLPYLREVLGDAMKGEQSRLKRRNYQSKRDELQQNSLARCSTAVISPCTENAQWLTCTPVSRCPSQPKSLSRLCHARLEKKSVTIPELNNNKKKTVHMTEIALLDLHAAAIPRGA
jgi:hypothetical protein